MPGQPTSARNTSLDSLHPALRARVERGLARARAEGLAVFLFEGLRSRERQNYLWQLGRSLPGKIVTRALPDGSWHEYGLAVDFAFDGNPETPKVDWTWNGNWHRLGEIMMAEGLDWFGLPGSEFQEAPHFQLTGGLWIKEAQRLRKLGGLPKVWEAVDQRVNIIERSMP